LKACSWSPLLNPVWEKHFDWYVQHLGKPVRFISPRPESLAFQLVQPRLGCAGQFRASDGRQAGGSPGIF
jgi:hypothetical protein